MKRPGRPFYEGVGEFVWEVKCTFWGVKMASSKTYTIETLTLERTKNALKGKKMLPFFIDNL
jgi:hypothetical protein